MTNQCTQFLAQPKDGIETASAVPLEPLNPMVLVQYGGSAVAAILAISILILALAEFVKVLVPVMLQRSRDEESPKS